MNEAKKPEYILAELTLCGKKKVHLLVEGDFDLSFWRNKIHPDINIVCCSGKENIKEIFKIKDDSLTILALLDFDYASVCPSTIIQNDDIIYTDYNDLETTLLSLGIAEKVITTLCCKEKMKSDNFDFTKPQSIFRDSLTIGQLRYINYRDNLNVKIKNIDNYYLNNSFDKDKLYKDFCKSANISEKELFNKIKSIKENNIWLILRGHDCIRNLNYIVAKYKNVPFPKRFSASDRLITETNNMYKKTLMVQKMRKWEINHNICILPED